MSHSLNELLKNPAINGWNLFWLVAGPVSAAMLVAMLTADLSSGEGISSLIQLSVRCAVPILYVVFAASAIQTLFPGAFGRWLLRNRKYLGLGFAAAMAWQGLFILWMVIGYTDYYVQQVYVLRDAIEGVTGYVFLLAMTVTSFPRGRKLINPGQWRLLHLSGIYFLWAYAFSVYWWALYYYSNPVLLDHVYYWGGIAAWGLRVAAWGKRRRKAAAKDKDLDIGRQPVAWTAGLALIGVGLAMAGSGTVWQGTAEELLYGYSFTRIPELYLPYWPFEPFLALAVILGGVYFTTWTGDDRGAEPRIARSA